MNQDQEHLKLLAIFHYVLGGLYFLIGFIPLIYVLVGGLFIANPGGMIDDPNGPPPEIMGWAFVAIGCIGSLLVWGFSIGLILSGRSISGLRRQTLSLVVAGVSCLCFPFGTALGVFTFIVLLRPTVKQLYETSTVAS